VAASLPSGLIPRCASWAGVAGERPGVYRGPEQRARLGWLRTAEFRPRLDPRLSTLRGWITIACVVSLQTALCRQLGIAYPVFSVGMGMGAGPELAAAVSNAGGFGVLGSDGLSPEQIPQTVQRTRQLTARPFGVNFIIAPLEDPDGSEEDKAEVRQLVAAAIAERVAAIVLFWGDAGPFVEAAHRNRVRVLLQVGSVEEAQTAADAAALAAAQALAIDEEGPEPAALAGEYAERNGAVLETCSCERGTFEATVSVRLPVGDLFLVAGDRTVQARARAQVDLPAP